ncbi:MAG: DUF192 domain-containing protein [Gemmatimonadetes bacterium]|nr:DUF192 domain-containing protein [Gemmatimonadota bacterium]
MSTLRVVNETRGAVVGSRVRVADRFWSRLRGFLGRPQPSPGEGLLLTPCDGVHMFGVRFPLDVVFLTEDGTVVHLVEGLRPWQRTSRVTHARAVLEVPVGTLGRTGTMVGDRLGWDDLEFATPLARRSA